MSLFSNFHEEAEIHLQEFQKEGMKQGSIDQIQKTEVHMRLPCKLLFS